MRPLGEVVLQIPIEHGAEVPLSYQHNATQALSANTAHKSLSVGIEIWRRWRQPHRPAPALANMDLTPSV